MAQILPWVALILSALVLGFGAVRGSRPKGGGLLPFAAAGAGVVLVAILATLPKSPPWTPTQGMWPGLLLGGLAVLIAAALGERLASEADRALAGAVEMAAPTAALSVLLLAYVPLRSVIVDTLGGFVIGALAVGILLAARPLAEGEERASSGAVLPAVALAVATNLALWHQGPAGAREWLHLPVLFGATVTAGLTLRAAVGRTNAWAGLAAALLPPAVMAWLIAYNLKGTPPFFTTVLLSLALFGVLAWLGRSEAGEAPRFRADTGLLGSLLVLGGAALAFRGLFGYGIALAALTGLVVARLCAGEAAAFVERAAVLALLLAVYRVYTEINAYTSGFQPDFLYYYASLVAGALLPALLAGSVFRWAPAEGALVSIPGAVVRAGLVGASAVLAPLLLWVLVGERPQAAFLVGLPVGAGFLLSRHVTGGRPAGELRLADLAALAAGWSAVQFTYLLTPLGLTSRPQRVVLLVAIGVVVLAVIGITAAMERRAPRRAPATAE